MKLTVAGEEYDVQYVERLEIGYMPTTPLPRYITFDTETDGLHLKKARPFLGAIAWDGQVYVFPATTANFATVGAWAGRVSGIYCHNCTYDMSMMANVMGDEFVLGIKNWKDSMCLARLSFEAISVRDGGDSLALKAIGKKYIDPESDQWEKQVKAWLKAREAFNRKVLIAALKPFGWSLKRLSSSLNDGTEELPTEILQVLNDWHRDYPKPSYQDVPMETMLPYVATDVILTNILVRKAMPVVAHREQVGVMEREFNLLPVVFKMERAGLKVDREYLQEAKYRLDQYIQDLTIRMHELSGGIEFKVGQHQKIKELYAERLGFTPESTNKKFLKKQSAQGDELAGIITKLRTLEKWRETYIERILDASEYDGRFYTSMNQFNPISGRFSGDMQQNPKKAIEDADGNELFHPRRAFVVSGDGYNRMCYIDLSQIELRCTAHYTLYFGGDLNMCRAYMPFKCKHYKTGQEFNYEVAEERARWDERQPSGESAWLDETGKPWTPTDVHSATTTKALIAMGKDPATIPESEWKYWRQIGKTFNFMRNYGGGDTKAAETLEIDIESAKAMNRGFSEAFPTVVTYQNAVSAKVTRYGYAENLFGRRYYLSQSWRFYKAANYLIQGSCADDLKQKMITIDRLLTDHNCKSRLVLCVHDEVVVEVYQGEEWVVPQVQKIMEFTPLLRVPVVAEVESTESAWSEKQPFKTA